MTAASLLYQQAAALPEVSGRMAVLHAQACPELASLKHWQPDIIQHFKPEHHALSSMGLKPQFALQGEYRHILLLPSKSKQQSQGWMAEAMLHLTDKGRLHMAAANDQGARAYEKLLGQLAGEVSSTSKSKCRIFSATKGAGFDQGLAEGWLRAAQAQPVASHGLISQPGLFSWDRADIGSGLLLQHLPALQGDGMDLCCGYGLLAVHIFNTSPQVGHLHLVDADALAVQCAQANTQQWSANISTHWLDAARETLPGKLDWIVCNPPFHEGHTRDTGLGQAIIAQACRSLKPGGQLFLVANRQLPYEHILQENLGRFDILAQQQGFKIIRGQR